MRVKLSPIFEDEFIVAINKPTGLLSIPDRFDSDKPNAFGLLKNNYSDIYLCFSSSTLSPPQVQKSISNLMCSLYFGHSMKQAAPSQWRYSKWVFLRAHSDFWMI